MIKTQLFVITIFLSNIAFTTILPADAIESFRDITITQEQNEETKNTLHNAAVTHLIDKGLDADVAKERVEAALTHSELEAELLAKQIVKNEKISYNDIVKYVANAALYQKRVDLSQTQELAALLQRSKSL